MRRGLRCGLGIGLLGLLVAAAPRAQADLYCAQVGAAHCAERCAAFGQTCVDWWKGECEDGSAPYVYYCNALTIEYECLCHTCFLAGTEITLADGGTKAIEEIEVGDVVLAYDEAGGEMKPDAVRAVHEPSRVDSYLVVNGRLHLTPTHPVLSGGEWVKIGHLGVGDTLTAADGSAVVIESVETVHEPVTVYNFAVNPYGTYVADGIVVHNKSPTPVPWEPKEP